MAAGQPVDLFKVPRELPPPGNSTNYQQTPERGLAMSNIGDCLPDVRMVGMAGESAKIAELDAKFAALKKAPPGSGTSVPDRIGLPERLEQTDLFTLDTATLARHRVLAYAPTYPLWSDNARKLRHVRVPAGTSIRFDKATQTFDIPPNTRFYKTFFKPLIEKGGNLRYRKVETRIIVARPDRDRGNGVAEATALFGTYKWDDAEQQATLVTETLNNLEPFKDQLLNLIMDEDKAEAVRAATPPTANLAKALEEAGATRKYAIPGSERCIQCHMGSPTNNFILGFFPLQVHRRPAGEGGVIEPSGPDELTQLQRFIDYGIITGMTSPADLTLLEDSQGERKPRNDYELEAQGYLIGNCTHCHNPRGFPSVENPVLKDFLNFLPSDAPPEPSPVEGCRKQGGIFRFPLECRSPRILRGAAGDTPIPYITPSLMDYPTTDSSSYVPKGTGPSANTGVEPYALVLAPWRSLIYRNVDTPFTYADGGAIFPHMPMNVAGFDCRAPRIIGDWMVSIAAERLNPEIPEDFIPGAGAPSSVGTDVNPQPYREITQGDAKYAKAEADAQTRLKRFHDGYAYGDAGGDLKFSRYAYCHDTSNIQDPWVTLQDQEHLAPPDQDTYMNGVLTMPSVGTPRRAHWVVTDATEPKVSGWNPRRDDWQNVLINHCFCNEKKAECKTADGKVNKAYECVGSDDESKRKNQSKQRVIEILNPTDPAAPGVHWSDELKQYAESEIPFGIWQEKAGCDYSAQPTAGSFAGADRPAWMDVRPVPPPTAHVYKTTPGAAVFGMICVNCHGPEANSLGRMADTIVTMTGGSTRVANLREGLFGGAGANRSSVFGKAATANTTGEDWAARYLTWMAMGGTTKLLPLAVIRVVANTQALGVKRRGSTTLADPNMLETAKHLCSYILPRLDAGLRFDPTTASFNYEQAVVPVVASNGDLALWKRLCVMGQPAPLRILLATEEGATGIAFTPTQIANPANYPSDAPVGNHLGKVESGVQSGNQLPWCWVATASGLAAARAYAHEHAVDGRDLPECPTGYQTSDWTPNVLTTEQKEGWAERGAINAGMAVFMYLDALGKGAKPRAAYNDCPSP
jgi:mono/diheme cytochrome c family protein